MIQPHQGWLFICIYAVSSKNIIHPPYIIKGNTCPSFIVCTSIWHFQDEIVVHLVAETSVSNSKSNNNMPQSILREGCSFFLYSSWVLFHFRSFLWGTVFLPPVLQGRESQSSHLEINEMWVNLRFLVHWSLRMHNQAAASCSTSSLPLLIQVIKTLWTQNMGLEYFRNLAIFTSRYLQMVIKAIQGMTKY